MLGGELIYQTSDEYGDIEVIDYFDKIRALHFGNKTQQSASLLCNPYFLIHKYAQAMLLPLCWLKPERTLILGLGAGSIVKYLYNYHPEIIIDSVELRQTVIDVARRFFMLPDESHRLNLYNDAIEHWLSQPFTHKYDLIIVDVFLTTDGGADITIDVSQSLEDIYNMLSSSGSVVFNYLGNNITAYPGYQKIVDIFKNQLYTINIDSGNTLLIGSRADIPLKLDDEIFEKLLSISSLPYQSYFNLMKKI